ncbi:thymidylate synthase [Candidatus Woesearchaeota archaeon]|nr:thymidylate synthase [Candidatus Woesearchaeota archaeon]
MNNMNQEYHDYLLWILSDENSVFKDSRAGGTIANTGAAMKFDLSKGVLLINTKKLFYRGLIHEMVWFMRGPENDGQLHVDYMVENKCNFWNKDLFNHNLKKEGRKLNFNEFEKEFKEFEYKLKSDKEFRKKVGGLDRPYGAQWRDWTGSNGEHIDQLANVIEAAKNRSDSRRLKVESWKVDEIDNMALPPCPTGYQFVVMNDRLDIVMNQRSADSFLGVPMNIGEYGLLGIFVAEYAGLKPGIFTHDIVDAHIYCGVEEKAEWYSNNLEKLKDRLHDAKKPEDFLKIKNWIDRYSKKPKEEWKEDFDHVTAVLEQLARDTNKYPQAQLKIHSNNRKPAKELLDTVSFYDFEVVGYKDNHYDKIERSMSTG